MASKVFLDANVILDFLLQRPAGYSDARDLIQKGVNGEIRLYTNPAVLHIVSYYTRQAYDSAIAKTLLLTLLTDVQIIDCDLGTALIAITSNIDDIEDALQYYTALKEKMDYFTSSDKKLKKAAIPQLPVHTPGELLNLLGTNKGK